MKDFNLRNITRAAFVLICGALLLLAGMALVGSFLPAEHRVSLARDFPNTQREALFDLVARPAGYPDWRSHLRATPDGAVEILSEDRWVERFGQDRVRFRFVEMNRPHRLVTEIENDDLPYGGRWLYEFESLADGGTRLQITEEGVIHNPVFRFVARFFIGHETSLESFFDDLAQAH